MAAVCPRCRRTYESTARVCAHDGATLLAEAQASGQAGAMAAGGSPMRVMSPNEVPVTEGEERLGPYRLLRVLGEGGMARVYLAEHVTLGRRCAIKRLHHDHFADRITVNRFLAEARAVSGIRHPNLVAIYDVIDEPTEICLVMEYLDGRDLGQILRDNGPFYPERAAQLCAQACDGLAAVHARGIIHRDLKPDNLFLAREGDGRERVKLLDFGVARLNEERPRDLRTKTGQTVGTPQYMSPEQATASLIDPRSDLYMMGVVLFELVTGQPPFSGPGYGDVMLMHVHDPPPKPSVLRPGMPLWLEDVILRCLAKEPSLRFASARELATALRREATEQVRLPEKLGVRHGWSTGAWLALIGGALGLGVLLTVALLLFAPGRGTQPPPSTTPVAHTDPIGGKPAPVTRAAPPKMRVVSQPPGAALHVGGELKGVTPYEVELPTGALGVIEVSVSAPGYAPERRLIDLGSPPSELRVVLRRRVGRSSLSTIPSGPPVRSGGSSSGSSDRNSTVDPFR